MAVAKKCDRCGTYHDGQINKLTTAYRDHYILTEHDFDLCDECMDEFDKAMEGSAYFTLHGEREDDPINLL